MGFMTSTLSFLLIAHLSFAASNKTAVITFDRSMPMDAEETQMASFNPTKEQIKVVEDNLKKYLNENHPKLSEKYSTYFRQYAGLRDKNGKMKIRGNFLCRVNDDRWQREWVLVLDGGECFFQFSFDLEKATFSKFNVNRQA